MLTCNFKILLDPAVIAEPERKLIVYARANMLRPRQAFGLCAVNNFIYVGGGVSGGNSKYTWTTDRYDVLNDTWENLKQCNFPEAIFANSFIAIRKRFIYQLGFSAPFSKSLHKPNTELVFRLDTFNLDAGWTSFVIKNPIAPCGC